MFIHTHQQRFIVLVLKRILKHDNEGILITQGDKIILCNQKFRYLFQLSETDNKDRYKDVLSNVFLKDVNSNDEDINSQ
jgi:hypothetical protein